MAITHITPQNWNQFVTPQGLSLDSRQYFPWHTVSFLQNRAGIHRSSAKHLAYSMRIVADGLDPTKPKAPMQQPAAIGILTGAEVSAEMARLRTMADYFDSIIGQFAPDPEPANA